MTRTLLIIVAVALAVALSGCVTSISSRAVQDNQNYSPIPQGIGPGPVEAPPAVEPAPEPYVPTPAPTPESGVKTTSFLQSLGDKMRGAFHR